jgi:hypothetical protein
LENLIGMANLHCAEGNILALDFWRKMAQNTYRRRAPLEESRDGVMKSHSADSILTEI